MSGWCYTNIGVSVTPENGELVEAILRYIGYDEEPECVEGYDDGYGYVDGIWVSGCDGWDVGDLLYLMNALFPGTIVGVHHAEGNTVSDTWEAQDETYDPATMTYSVYESYTDYGGGGPNGHRSWQERFAMQPPEIEDVQALIDISTEDGNGELTALLLELSRKLREGLIVYKDDPSDKRKIGEKYNVEERFEDEEEEDSEDGDDEEEEEKVDNIPGFQADIITFGHYPQTESGNDRTPIDWFVLKKDGNRALLISRYLLDARAYHSEDSEITWQDCTLRAWLNGDFLAVAFTEAEQEAILTTDVDNSPDQGNEHWGTKGGSNTHDKVFLLSWSEAERPYSNIERRCAVTPFAKSRGAYTNEDYLSDGRNTGWWWLRSPGYDQDRAARVYPDGSLGYNYVDRVDGCVRPAMWIDLDSGIF